MKVVQHRPIILLNIKRPQLSKPKARQQWQGTKTPPGDWMEIKILGEPRLSRGPVLLWLTYILYVKNKQTFS